MAKQRRKYRKKPKNSNSHFIFYALALIVIGCSIFWGGKALYDVFNKKNFKNLHISIREEYKIKDIYKTYSQNAFGIDISKYQGNIDWKMLKDSPQIVPISFVFVKATQGINSKDPYFNKNWAALKKSDYIAGYYHYYNVDENSEKQAQNFINTVKLLPGNLPPVLDVEELPRNQSLEKLKEGLQNWLNIIENYYRVKPIIYSNDAYFINHISDLNLSKYPIWVANYNPIKKPLHEKWYFWQFSDKAIIKGISINYVDLNVFNGNIYELKDLTIK